jgi:hypothetical protein
LVFLVFCLFYFEGQKGGGRRTSHAAGVCPRFSLFFFFVCGHCRFSNLGPPPLRLRP